MLKTQTQRILNIQDKNRWFWWWFLMLLGWIIWAWFFTLPKAIMSVGVVPWVIILIVLAITMIVFHLILAEIALSLPGEKTLIWIAKSALPKWLSTLTIIAIFAYFLMALIAYVALAWSFLHILIQQVLLEDVLSLSLYIHPIRYNVIFVVFMSFLQRNRTEKKNNLRKHLVFVTIACAFIVIAWGWTTWGNITSFSTNRWERYKMYGVALLAMNGMVVIPILYKTTGKSAIQMRAAILNAGFVVAILCLFFALAVLSLSWENTSTNTILWLFGISKLWGAIWALLGVFAISSCYSSVATHIQEVGKKDINIASIDSYLLVMLVPFLLYLYFTPDILNMVGIIWWFIWSSLIILLLLINIRLHKTGQKVKIMSMIDHDEKRSRALIVLCIIGIIWQTITLL